MISLYMDANTLISLRNSNLSVIQFQSATEAFEALNTINQDTLLELVPLMDGQILSIFASESSLLNVHEALCSHANTPAHCYIENISAESLKSFYSLRKPKLKESLLIGEVPTMVDLIQLIHYAHQKELEVLEHKNQRNFQKNVIYLSGTFQELESFSKHYKSFFSKVSCLEKISPSLLSFFSLIEP